MKKSILLPFIFLSVSCASINNSSDTNFKINSEREFIIGSSYKSVGKIEFINKRIGSEELRIIAYIDKLPFQTTIDLCPKKGKYKELKSLKKDKHGKIIAFEHIEKVVNCKTTLTAKKISSSYAAVYFDINALDGYNVSIENDYTSYNPISINYQNPNKLLKINTINEISKEIKHGKTVSYRRVSIFL